MSYSVKFTDSITKVYSALTECVLCHALVIAQLDGVAGGVTDYVTPTVGDYFDVFRVDSLGNRSGAIALQRATMASSAAGAVVVDDGTGLNRWRVGTVVNDGTSLLAPDRRTVPSTAPAAAVNPANGQVLPLVGTELVLLGVASDGTSWFYPFGQSVEAGIYFTTPQVTVADLPAGSIAVVLKMAQWLVMQL